MLPYLPQNDEDEMVLFDAVASATTCYLQVLNTFDETELLNH